MVMLLIPYAYYLLLCDNTRMFSHITLYICLNYIYDFMWFFMVMYSLSLSFDIQVIINAFIADLSTEVCSSKE